MEFDKEQQLKFWWSVKIFGLWSLLAKGPYHTVEKAIQTPWITLYQNVGSIGWR